MRGNHDLFDLIKSLSRSEKRHFRLYCNLQDGEKHYLKLFDVIQDLTVYDEKILKKVLNKHPVAKHWAFNKKYLYDKIIESLGLIKLKDDADLQISELVKTYKILRSKGLYAQSMRYLSMAKKKAKANELYARLYDTLNLEYHERAFSHKSIIDPKINSIREERNAVLKIIGNYSYVFDIFIELEKWIQIKGEATNEKDFDEINTIIGPLLGLKKDQFICNECWLFYIMAMAKYHQACGKPKNGFLLFQEHAHENSSSGNWQSMAIGIWLLNAVRSYSTINIDDLLDWLLQASDKPPYPYNYNAYEQWLYIKLCDLCVKGEFTNALAILDHEQSLKLNSMEQTMSKWGRLSNYYMMAYTYFGSGEVDKAAKWCGKVLDSNETEIPIYSYARILQLLILFEKGECELFDYRLRSFERYLRPRSPQCSLLKLRKLFSTLRSCHEKDKKELNGLAKKLISEFNRPVYSNTLLHVDIVSWINSKLLKVSFEASVKSRYANLGDQKEKKIFSLNQQHSQRTLNKSVA